MQVIGHGVDIVEVARIASMLEDHADRFLERVFTPSERAYADANPRRRNEHLAARFAAKEAAFKALGTGWAEGISWTEAEVIRDLSGKPSLAAHGAFAAIARSRGIARFWLSMSHTETHAIASVIAEGDAA